MSGVFQQTKGKTCSVADIDKCLAGVQVQEWRDTDFQTFKVNWFQLRVIKSELQDINLQLQEESKNCERKSQNCYQIYLNCEIISQNSDFIIRNCEFIISQL